MSALTFPALVMYSMDGGKTPCDPATMLPTVAMDRTELGYAKTYAARRGCTIHPVPLAQAFAAGELHRACEAFHAWLDSDRKGCVYPSGMHRDSTGGEAVWRAWFNGQLGLCENALTLADAALALARAKSTEPEPIAPPSPT